MVRSTITLAWLDGSPKRFKMFVGNRLSTILTDLPPSTWHHVPTLDNPADCASRGLSPSEVAHSLRWEGLPWLLVDPFFMPIQPLLVSGGTLELKAVCLSVTPVTPTWIEERFNSYHLLIHVTAWCLRFVSNTQAAVRGNTKCLTNQLEPSEVEAAEHHLFHLAQLRAFTHELTKLNHEQSIPSSSTIISLSP